MKRRLRDVAVVLATLFWVATIFQGYVAIWTTDGKFSYRMGNSAFLSFILAFLLSVGAGLLIAAVKEDQQKLERAMRAGAVAAAAEEERKLREEGFRTLQDNAWASTRTAPSARSPQDRRSSK